MCCGDAWEKNITVFFFTISKYCIYIEWLLCILWLNLFDLKA